MKQHTYACCRILSALYMEYWSRSIRSNSFRNKVRTGDTHTNSKLGVHGTGTAKECPPVHPMIIHRIDKLWCWCPICWNTSYVWMCVPRANVWSRKTNFVIYNKYYLLMIALQLYVADSSSRGINKLRRHEVHHQHCAALRLSISQWEKIRAILGIGVWKMII